MTAPAAALRLAPMAGNLRPRSGIGLPAATRAIAFRRPPRRERKRVVAGRIGAVAGPDGQGRVVALAGLAD